MSCLCEYKDIFGKPREGVHSYRLFDIAIVDMGMTMIGAYTIGYLYNKYTTKNICGDFNMSVLIIFIILLVLSIFVHKLFCVETTLTKIIFN